ncbi:MAG: DUF4433 domain-containing protein [Armatimonadota bacterium]|nr:DUF4433 domain-containing protein [Armatimonadota bacterium]
MHVYHATPLHYLPHILQSGALYAKSILAARGIAPRPTAVRRDRMLGLADWVHLSLRPDTPLLHDKLAKGYPHALLVFDREAILALPEVALLPYNTKAWRTRAACQPVTDASERADLLRRHADTGRFPSLEVLVHYGLDLTRLTQIAFVTEEERLWITDLLPVLAITSPAPFVTTPDLFPRTDDYFSTTGSAITAYFDTCREAGTLLKPPSIPFD